MQIDNDCIVSFHYKITGNEHKLLDSTANQEPLTYMHNTGGLLPALERALHGHAVGDVLTISLSPDEAYGAHHPELVQELPLHAFSGQAVSSGMYFDAKGKDGAMQRLMVKKVTADKVTVDANHPLAGEALKFEVAIVAVRKPTSAELEQGQPL